MDDVDNVLYYPILVIVMSIAGIYFTIRTRVFLAKDIGLSEEELDFWKSEENI